jgi:ubiquinone/menaquinone biosynthesis C-methylase UbiE
LNDVKPDQAMNAWDKAAAGWDAQAPLIRSWLSEATRLMLRSARVAPGAKVLDVAAGAGDQTLDIAQRVGAQGHVLAIDNSAAILRLAAERARHAGLAQVQVRVADAQSLGLEGAGFDAAVCRLGLMFCTSPLDALKGIHAALRPSASFSGIVFAAPEHNPCLSLQLSVARRHAGMPPASHEAMCQPGSLMSLGSPVLLKKLLADAGFVDIGLRQLDAPVLLPSVDRYVEFLQTAASPVIQLLASLSETARRLAWDDMRRELDVYTTPTGWVGPKALVLLSARA